MTTAPRLVATSWTAIGDVTPRDARWVSPIPLAERLEILAEQGWYGVGFTQDDLAAIRADGGFADLRRRLDEAGIGHVEVEFLSDWWCDGTAGAASRETEELLLDAAAELGAAFVKVGTAFAAPIDDLTPLVAPLAALGDRAAARGQRVVLEPAVVAMVESVPRGSELVTRADRDNVGLLVDLWHVLRAGTTPEELVATVPAGQVWAVELTDADAEPCGPDLFTDTVDNRRYCGDGDIDIPAVVDALRALGFDGPWGVEILSTEHRALPFADGLRRARDTARRFAR
ncbi:sugar phosphate isomerase [Pseudonocardia sulfidoxydans NBRC 16205]|uniref:Sugar phosphate isomerase n=1 Tax=Pseudonocardia sulfidoxydans NBRC 16205 TaxID=1223511 RepID=A0A511DBP8_9PSEU|nr:sugar phosphate isomerase/epimerase [Pseudonocardia sulfidoxydans]GEL22230.1 sugar phosphate isomerase [Pseudonocardia sulfidoxydans NBRC 16205]